MNTRFRPTFLLLVTAAIWGFAFVAQRVSMQYIGPFTFNAIRFFLGGLSMVPILLVSRRFRAVEQSTKPKSRKVMLGFGLLGLVLFMGASFQQVGIVYTTAGKAGFITGLYVIIVPLIGLVRRQRVEIGGWLGVVLAVAGLYLLSVTERLTMGLGDFLVLLSAFFWAVHVQVIGWLAGKVETALLALVQYVICAVLSAVAAVIVRETLVLEMLVEVAIPIAYAGFLSVGVAYTLQVVAQREASPTQVAILLSLEAVFAVLGGWLVLGEVLSLRALVGCALMLAGMFSSQFNPPHSRHL